MKNTEEIVAGWPPEEPAADGEAPTAGSTTLPPSREEFEALTAQVRRLAAQVANGRG